MAIENKRVYELAKEYGMSNKDFIEYLDKKLEISVKSHSSNLSPAQIDKIKASFNKNNSGEAVKKPKAFIVKKAKPAVEPAAEQKAEEKKPEVKVVKKQPEEEKSTSEETTIKETKKETPVNEKPKESPDVTGYRSLLEYNNRNSQKRKQEMLANKQRNERGTAFQKKEGEAPSSAPQQGRPQQKPAGDFKKEGTEKPRPQFDKNRPQFKRADGAAERGARPERADKSERPERSERPLMPKKPLQHHIISQEIYDGKSNSNQAFKKKGAKDKKKQYKNKEEEQELISLEKTQTQKHKKKAKDEGNGEAITQVVINEPVTVGELANKIGKSPAEIVKFLMMQGVLTTVNEVISVETQKKICQNFELEVLEEDLNAYIEEELEKEENKRC